MHKPPQLVWLTMLATTVEAAILLFQAETEAETETLLGILTYEVERTIRFLFFETHPRCAHKEESNF